MLQKKLMLLGGNRYQLPVIQAAHELGYYVITCDFLPDNIAHKYSDEYCNVSIIDREAVLNAAKKLHIDGIMSFACDPGVTVAAYVAEKLGLPTIGTYKAICLLQNKGQFRAFLAENGFNVPTAKRFKDKDQALKECDIFHWPVIVKPTDSAGSKGVTKVEDLTNLSAAIDYALEKSFSHEFIIEDYLEKIGCSSDTDCFSVNGELKFISFNSQRFDLSADNPFTPAAYSWPSTMTVQHEQELASELQRLISLLGLKSSIYNIETRECVDGKAYIMECTPRGGGNRLAEILKLATGVDLIKAAVLAAMGEDVTEVEQKPYIGHWAEVILHSHESGIFDELWLDDEIRQFVVEEDLWVQPGDAVEGFMAANNAIGTLILCFPKNSIMLEVLEHLRDHIRVKIRGKN